jgi:NADH-quinone oxidoreductase subunit M
MQIISGLGLLSQLIFLPLLGAAAVLLLRSDNAIRWTSLVVTSANLVLAVKLCITFDRSTAAAMQMLERRPWIPAWGIDYQVGVDGISILFILLAALLSVLCVGVSWRAIDTRTGQFHAALLVTETAMIGVFASLNLVLFFLFWELMLIPMFVLIGVWGGDNRVYAAFKLVLFTLAGSVLMLVGIIVLGQAGGGTFDLLALQGVRLPAGLQLWLFLAFLAAFAVKVPMFPLHTWLPDAHTEAPTAGSVILAGILLKMGAYGFLRVCLPLLPDATRLMLVPMLVLSVTALIYGAYVTLMQTELKRLIAYSSVSHMGLVTLGLFSLDRSGLEGGVLQMINHGLVTGALFLCVGIIYERTHSRQIADYGGLSTRAPRFATCFTIFALAAIGLPGLSPFIAELLILAGVFRTGLVLGALSILGIVLGVTYMVWLYYRLVLRAPPAEHSDALRDLDAREVLVLLPLLLLVVLIGVQPELVLGYLHAPLEQLLEITQIGNVSQISTGGGG